MITLCPAPKVPKLVIEYSAWHAYNVSFTSVKIFLAPPLFSIIISVAHLKNSGKFMLWPWHSLDLSIVLYYSVCITELLQLSVHVHSLCSGLKMVDTSCWLIWSENDLYKSVWTGWINALEVHHNNVTCMSTLLCVLIWYNCSVMLYLFNWMFMLITFSSQH